MAISGRTLLVTYCCREKDAAAGDIPARDRYLSPRIRVAEMAAGLLGWDFAILSGRHGLLAPGAPLAFYDHLLTADQVPAHAARIAGPLADSGVSVVVFLTRSPDVDPGTGPYRACVEEACRLAGLPLAIHTIGGETPAGPELAGELASS
jgi:hypothetical protein